MIYLADQRYCVKRDRKPQIYFLNGRWSIAFKDGVSLKRIMRADRWCDEMNGGIRK